MNKQFEISSLWLDIVDSELNKGVILILSCEDDRSYIKYMQFKTNIFNSFGVHEFTTFSVLATDHLMVVG